MEEKTVYLVDATSLCYRSFFAIKLSNSKGFPTGAIYGFFKTLRKIQTQFMPRYMGICFDVSRKTFRQEKYKDYKINRPPLPDGLKTQIPLIKKLVGFLGMPLLEREGFEADDIIAALTKKAIADDMRVVIVSSDKDIYQLLCDKRVAIYNATQEQLLREEDFVKEFGFGSHLIVDYLALSGDSADNIPGAQGIGKVGASKLIQEFGTVENIFQNLGKVTPKVKTILEAEKENIFLSKDLARLAPQAVDAKWQDLFIKEPDWPKLYAMFSELEFKTLLKEIPAPSLNLKINVKEGLGDDTLLVKSPSVIWADELESYVYLSGESVYKLKGRDCSAFLEDMSIQKISYDFKSQLHAQEGKIKNLWFDVMIAAYVLDPALADYSLTNLCSHYLGTFAPDVPKESIPYFSEKLYQLFLPQLKDAGLENLFFNIEMPLVSVLWEMESTGVSVDMKIMERLLKELGAHLGSAEEKIFKIAGKHFNLNSPQQLRVVLFEELKITPLQKTKTGYSTSEEVLEILSKDYPIATLLLEYRQLNKLKTTYVAPLIEMVKLRQGRLHATFNQASTQTGRLSSSSPNLQSIPAKGKFSSSLRKAFVSSFKNGYILSADYSQIELRILAHFSADAALCEAFEKNVDIHRYTASLLFGVKELEVLDTQRDIAKRVNFAILYGMTSYGLAAELGISREEAETFIENYFLRYPKVKTYIDNVLREAEKNGYVKTILGRRRALTDIKSHNIQLKEFARRQAVNTPIQGSCADLIKSAMVKIHRECKEKKLRIKLIIQIHDELVFDVPDDEVKLACEIVQRNMQECIKLHVPVKVNLKIGRNWGQLQDIDAWRIA